METSELEILNATLIEPRFKHAAIFERFDQLNHGDSFILMNDHDPKPLYYQLINERGDYFTWEYLEEGPVWWRIKIGIPSDNSEAKESASDNEDNVLNVTLIEPRLKHPTIFGRFDNLQEGESLIILNDHDPKPLYYQLLGMHGETFIWDYLEKGPQWWRIKITKKVLGEGQETLGEIAAKDLRKAQIFKKYGLDFCCGGKKTVKEACEDKGLDIKKVEDELQHADTVATSSRPLPYNDWGLDFLADYIVNTHHSYLRKNLPDIRAYASKVLKVHGMRHPELEKVYQLVEDTSNELLTHMQKEENTLFPFIKKLVGVKNGMQLYTPGAFGTVENPVKNMIHEHQKVGDNLHELRHVTNNYALPEDACASYSLLYRMLDEMEDDVLTHIHLENNILFPKAIELEKELRKG